jgi:hypothetical protein
MRVHMQWSQWVNTKSINPHTSPAMVPLAPVTTTVRRPAMCSCAVSPRARARLAGSVGELAKFSAW